MTITELDTPLKTDIRTITTDMSYSDVFMVQMPWLNLNLLSLIQGDQLITRKTFYVKK